MAIVPVPSGAVQGFDDDAWDDLLNYIEERRVIPIVGPDLLRVNTPSGPRPLYEWLAEKLAVRLTVGRLLEGMTAEARALATTRQLSALIASARAS